MKKSGSTSEPKQPARRGRGRPRAFDREAALAEATRLFWQNGYEATSIADLTEAMGIGSPSLYAAFGSKDALYAEALRFYVEKYEALVWDGFNAATTARAAVEAYLAASAATFSGAFGDFPRGCMVTLSSIGSEGHEDLCALVRSGRCVGFDRVKARLNQAVAEGELPASLDVHALARFVQTVQSGMSILARDGASRSDLEAVAQLAMLGWDARTGPTPAAPAAKRAPARRRQAGHAKGAPPSGG
ncbi:TetR family transcriptional regulator [Acuticoccus sediminis]|uniref:TetR family transcriptional regulator n=1 Tax=Acuticoccus sediminis TaxID=2184697 RepID=A0A8B2P3V2_9HYPH|nr:TetR/AcrR family transcriptional regulator [Acuticoccus sediminis]RAI03802.1 TetR family transcriptional regulator [Acuticoccus sediminis]